jgi:predicted nucleic acid-binding protein
MTILDTNVVSELMRREPARSVLRWVDARPASQLYTTSITQAEVLHGIRLLPKGKRRDAIADAADRMFDEDFVGRVLVFGADAARAYADIAVARRRAGRPIAAFDAQIAAIARATRASLATRNIEDFAQCGIDLVDPWTG